LPNCENILGVKEEVPKCGVPTLYPLNYERGRILTAVVGPVYINLDPEHELPYSNDFRDKQGVLKLMVGALFPSIPYTG